MLVKPCLDDDDQDRDGETRRTNRTLLHLLPHNNFFVTSLPRNVFVVNWCSFNFFLPQQNQLSCIKGPDDTKHKLAPHQIAKHFSLRTNHKNIARTESLRIQLIGNARFVCLFCCCAFITRNVRITLFCMTWEPSMLNFGLWEPSIKF